MTKGEHLKSVLREVVGRGEPIAGVEETYRIVRFSMVEPTTTIKEGLTLEEAEEHCQRDDTHGPGWFDGYKEEVS